MLFQQMLLTLHSGHLVLKTDVARYLSSPPLRGNMQNFQPVCDAIFQARISSRRRRCRYVSFLHFSRSLVISISCSSHNRFRLLSIPSPTSNFIHSQNNCPLSIWLLIRFSSNIPPIILIDPSCDQQSYRTSIRSSITHCHKCIIKRSYYYLISLPSHFLSMRDHY